MEINEKYGKLISIFWVLLISKNLISDNLTDVGKFNGLINVFVYLVIVLYFVYMIHNMKGIFVLNLKSAYLLIVILLFVIVWMIVDPSRMSYDAIMDDMRNFISYSLSGIILISAMSESGLILKYLYKYIIFMFAALIIGFGLFFAGGGYNTAGVEYSMSYGNNAAFVCVLLCSKFNRTRNPIDLILACISFFAIIRIGSRFPILYIVAYLIVSFFLKLKGMGKMIVVILGGTVVTFVLRYWDCVTKFVIRITSNLDIQGRTVSYLKWGMLSYDNGRKIIHQNLIECISDSPVIGYGFGGGVVALKGEGAHSFLLDCFGNLGYVFGIPFVVVAFLCIFIAWYRQRSEDAGEVILVLGCCFFPTVNIQTTLWGGYRFWWMVALSISYFTYSKKRRSSYYRYWVRGKEGVC